jgi:hypothetical protein
MRRTLDDCPSGAQGSQLKLAIGQVPPSDREENVSEGPIRSTARPESGALAPVLLGSPSVVCGDPLPTVSGRGHESRRFVASGRAPRGLTNVGPR